MNAAVTPVQPNPLIADIEKTAHGLSLPGSFTLMAVYVDNATGDILPADATATSTQKTGFVTTIYDANNVRVQLTGFLLATAHGLTVGEYYYVTDAGDGGFSPTPGTVNDVAFFVWDSNHLVLVDNRPV